MEKPEAFIVPTIVEENHRGARAWDPFSLLFSNRIIFLEGEIKSETASLIVAQLLYLDSASVEKDKPQDICIYLNSPGGLVTAGLAIYDTMRYIKPDVSTICIGQAASMAAVLLAAGTKGKRFALPHAEVMIHQPLGGMQGQATDIEIAARHMMRIRAGLNEILARHTGQPVETILRDTERDNFKTAEEAVAYGLIDKIIDKRE